MRPWIITLMLALPAVAAAQDRSAAFVGGSVSAVNAESKTDLALTGSFGYRVSRVVAFVIETTVAPDVGSSFPSDRPVILAAGNATVWSSTSLIYPGPVYTNQKGRIVLFTNAARIDIPTTSRRVTPFFTAGGGIGNIRRTADFTYPFPILTAGGAAPPTIPIEIRPTPITQRIKSSATELALTLGGGVGVGITRSLALDVDLRVFRLLGDEDHNLGRFGVGARYTF